MNATTPIMRTWVTIVLAAALSWPLTTAAAHTRSSIGYSQIRQSGSQVHYDLRLEYDVLAKVTGLGHPALGARTDRARIAASTRARPVLAAYLRPRLLVAVDGVRCASRLARVGVARLDRAVLARFALTYACPGAGAGSYEAV